MECTWDTALLQRANELPEELIEAIRQSSHQDYLSAFTRAALIPRHTYTLFAHSQNLFAHICADLRSHGSLPQSVATLGRVVPFASYLVPYAQVLLSDETYQVASENDSGECLLYLLGVFRLLRHDSRTFCALIDPTSISELLSRRDLPVVYLAIRILQILFDGADHWFELMLRLYLGGDNPDVGLEGLWDDKVIDYRFLTLWEEERFDRVRRFLQDAVLSPSQTSIPLRQISADHFHATSRLVGGVLLPSNPSEPINDDLVATATISQNLHKTALSLRSNQPLLLSGLAGSGKTLLVRHVAKKLGKLDKMVTLHLNEQSDAKLLVGIYATGDSPGSFSWKPGVLTTAVQEGRWVCIEDLDRAPQEIVSALLPLIERGELSIPNRKQTIHAKPGFRILATVRSTINHRGEETKPLGHMLGRRHWNVVHVDMPSATEQNEIASLRYPSIRPLLPQFMTVFERLQKMRQGAVLVGQSKTGILRPISPRDLLKWCSRVASILQGRASFSSNDLDHIFMEALDCFVGALPFGEAKSSIAAVIAEELHIDPQRRDYLAASRDVKYEADKTRITVGRYVLPRSQITVKTAANQGSYSTNPQTSRMLERVAAAVINKEPLLLVGETGVGKTTAVQHLAGHIGRKLVPFNLSQQSEVGDLLGGFKPVNARSLMVPMKDEFDELFTASFSRSKNQQYIDLLAKQMAKGNWKAVCKLLHQALEMVDQQRATVSRQGAAPPKKRKVELNKITDFNRWDVFAEKVRDMEHRLAAGNEDFAFSFVEGNIIKAVRNGNWILLDEINLASADTLESIADLLDPTSPSILLTEAGNVERIEAHPDFRIFAAMNPATDVGKKDLPPGIRSRFTELYVDSPDKDLRSLQSIVRVYLRTEATADQAVALDVSTLYQQIVGLAEQNKLVDGAAQKPHFSLRTLTRTLSYARYITPSCNLRRALYEGFQMSFMTFLDAESSKLVQPLLEQHLFGKRTNVKSELQKALRKPSDGHSYVQGYPGSKHWVRQGGDELQEQPQYIITPFIRSNLENLVRASSTRQFPVLIQGPTSSGKTSMIEYLAKRTGHQFVRINNHEHTDLQEYLGTYISGADGKLQFQEGVLVKALREGHWIVLDELNLAPTDVLEALNRLLDDNRELFIPETQEVVRPHENFMLFATQNPAGLYGGRKTLSRAFRNRFLELHFDDIPVDELQEILHKRTELPESRCKRIVSVYRELSVLRQENRIFEQKSFATLRDLFRWAMRTNDTIEQLAANGFMLLAERVRKPEEREAVKTVIEKVMSSKGPRVTIDEVALYSSGCAEIKQHQQSASHHSAVWTKAMRRLYALVARAIKNNEPVLLVGETGCGKTTVCQMLGDALKQELHIVNAHQNTETGDLIGSQRPVRNRAATESELRKCLLTSPPLQSLGTAAAHSTEALLTAYDNAVHLLTGDEKRSYLLGEPHLVLQSARTRFKALFEWADGSLVQAMKNGAFFLLDEISLADDSVLERINSVLEPSRSILLAEKGSLDSFVAATQGFQFFATMNPGGDYGKRELSPALRNRFTEIWVPALSDLEDVVQIVRTKLSAPAKPFAESMVAFAQWFRAQYNTSASSSVSIRDVLAWCEFVTAFSSVDITAGIVHGAAMVYIDTLGANPAGLMTLTGRSLDAERRSCLSELGSMLAIDATSVYDTPAPVTVESHRVTFGPFTINKSTSAGPNADTFSFDAPTTQANAMRVVRAMQLAKPVMLEGSPGVGKTALVTAISKAAGVPLTRINLSEQTDLMDLFGSDTPVQGAEAGTFAWRDASFLRAMKRGEWVLLDEMNLASQSVLEGLNACLDHRGEVFVPEIGQTFARHPHFRLFAAQNPHHQGGGRKGLPASFVNRFTVVYADAFRSEDLTLICRRSFPAAGLDAIQKAVQFVDALDTQVVQQRRFGAHGGPWEFNLRDISRWLSLIGSEKGLLGAGKARDFVEILFSQRFRSAADRARIADIFSVVYDMEQSASDLYSSISSSDLQFGLGVLPRETVTACHPKTGHATATAKNHFGALQSLMIAIQSSWPVLLSGSSGSGKSAMIQTLAATVGASMETFAMNAETDAMDLTGGYEQADPYRQSLQLLDAFCAGIDGMAKSAMTGQSSQGYVQIAAELHRLKSAAAKNPALFVDIARFVRHRDLPGASELLAAIEQSSMQIDKASFVWIDGILVDALEQGKWLVLDNANLCSPSVLDRLNSLLEPNGSLIINEQVAEDGTPRIIHAHPRFRIFLTVDPRYGELSRAMRNRALEIHLLDDDDDEGPLLNPLHPESTVARFRHARALGAVQLHPQLQEQSSNFMQDYLGLQDLNLARRFERQIANGLYQGVSFSQELQVAQHDNTALELSRSREQLKAFYELAASQKQVSADFACVQTLHPLNNQPLVQQSEDAFIEAHRLAFLHELRREVHILASTLQVLRTDRVMVSKLIRLERAQSHRSKAAKKGETSSTLEAITMAIHLAAVRSEELSLGDLSLNIYRRGLNWLLGSLRNLLDIIARQEFDQAVLSACFAVARKVPVSDNSGQIAPVLSEMGQHLSVFTDQAGNAWGAECVPLWEALRPATPKNTSQLDELLKLEQIVDRFDHESFRFRLPLKAIAELRLSFALALSRAKAGGENVQQLAAKLDSVLPEDKPDTEEEHAWRPHFESAFVAVSRHFALLQMSNRSFDTIEQASIHSLALQPTTTMSSEKLHDGSTSSVHHIFGLLRSLSHSSAANDGLPGASMTNVMYKRLSDQGAVSINQLSLLDSEVQMLGLAFARETNAIVEDELPALDQGLSQLLHTLLGTLGAHSRDSTLRETCKDLQLAMAGETPTSMLGDEQLVTLPAEQRHLTLAARYLITPRPNYVESSHQAARAWMSLALACFKLYLPTTPFDPALEPRTKRHVHQYLVKQLMDQLQALRYFNHALSTNPSTLRTTLLEDELKALGPAPDVPEVCRPGVSEMAQLQMDFDGLRRILDNISLESTAGLGSGLLANLHQMRTRLSERYRAYSDLTLPVLAFIDCLLLGQHLSREAAAKSSISHHGSNVTSLIPFHGASLATWNADIDVLQALPSTASQDETMLWLAAFAARCSSRPVSQVQPQLKHHLEQQFSRLYEQWRAELGRDQRYEAAKSSLYRYTGDADMQDEPSQEQVDEMFPFAEANASSTAAQSRTHDRATQIAALHRNIFTGTELNTTLLLDLLSQHARLCAADAESGDIKSNIPTLVLRLQQLASSLGSDVPPDNQRYNIYTSSNMAEVRRLLEILRSTERRFEELHQAWPDHATPLDALRLCQQVGSIGHAEPLVRFLPTIEKLHATVAEWQKIASREYSAITAYEAITDLIVSWRQLELSSWAGLFDQETRRAESDAASWWFIAYETIIAATEDLPSSDVDAEQHAAGLVSALEEFFHRSGLGEYHARLEMLRDFEAHLKLRSFDSQAFKPVHNALVNFIAYFSHFEKAVGDALTAGRSTLEKGVKEVIQLASWKDRNVETLRQSAKNSHRKLFKSVRKYQALLGQPVAQILQAGVPGLPFTPESRSRSRADLLPLTSDQEQSLVSAVPSWSSKPLRFSNISATANLISAKSNLLSEPANSGQKVADFLSDLEESMTELQKATPKLLTEKTEPTVKHLKARKRRLLAEVLKNARAMGFKHNISQDVLTAQSSLSRILAGLQVPEIHGARDIAAASQHHLHQMLCVMPSVREAVRKHSDDLTAAETARCASYLESMLSLSIGQQSQLCQYLRTSQTLHKNVAVFEAYAACEQPALDNAKISACHAVEPRMATAVLNTAAALVKCQAQLSLNDYGPTAQRLEEFASSIADLHRDMESLTELPPGILREQQLQLRQQYADTVARLRSELPGLIAANQELEPTLCHVQLWLPDDQGGGALGPNDAASGTVDSWTQESLTFLDSLLVAVQRLETSISSHSRSHHENAWLYQSQDLLASAWVALDPTEVGSKINKLLNGLQSSASGSTAALSHLSAISRSVFPLLDSYVMTCERVLSGYASLHKETNRMGFILASTFINLARDGFCTPPDKSQESKQDSGDVETGTGLGEGEGGEDISKDVGADEDLSELAQEGQKEKDDKDDIEDEKDAVDMADQEMEGELGDAETGSQADDQGDEKSEGEELDEETGDVGDLDDGAVDEKMWDEGKAEQENEKEAESGKGTAQDKDMSAAGEGEKEEDAAGDEGEMEEDAGAGAEEEDVARKETETADPHLPDQENLDLPEDMNMDDDKPGKDDVSDIESMADDNVSAEGGADDEHMSDASSQAEHSNEEPDQKRGEDAEDDATETQEAGEEADQEPDEEQKDDQGLLQSGEKDDHDVPAEGDVAGEDGQGQDQDDSKAQAADGVSGEDDEQETDPAAQAQQQSGTQGGANDTHESSEGAEQSSAAQRQWPYKQLGDVLDEWYKQQRQIEAPQQSDSAHTEQQQRNIDMANTRFEHLPDADAEADTQALGTASAEQSGALNEETSRPVNEDNPAEEVPFQEMEDDAEQEAQDQQDQQEPRMEPSDQLLEARDAKAFVGDKTSSDDVEMGDDAQSLDDDDVEDMDGQLLNTHISNEELSEEMDIEEARLAWSKHESSTRNLALILTEHLRLILQPTQATKMRGDFRTGKRLNIKRIIPYIASSYKRDKIWMRRSIPSKRSYQIMLAIDDSKSMDESDGKALAFETLALVAKSMAMLEVGELCVLGFGENVKVAHDFSTPFTTEAGAEVFKSFTFAQSKTNVRKMLIESLELFRAARLKAVGSASELWQLQLIISDGVCEDHPSIRQLVRQAYEERIMIVFVVVDPAAQKAQAAGAPKQSIVDLQSAEFSKNAAGEMQLKMVKYLDTFPFKYYLIVRDVQDLPGVLAGALRQWFVEVVDSDV